VLCRLEADVELVLVELELAALKELDDDGDETRLFVVALLTTDIANPY